MRKQKRFYVTGRLGGPYTVIDRVYSTTCTEHRPFTSYRFLWARAVAKALNELQGGGSKSRKK